MSARLRQLLLVEDSDDTAAELGDTLRRLGYAVVGRSSSGEDALRDAADLKPDLILMDVKLEGEQDGIETAALLRGVHDAPVVFMTSHGDVATMERARRSEPYGYLLKPLEERELDVALHVAFDRHELIRDLRARAAALAESQRDLSVFASLASHDLMEPIRAMFQNLTLLRESQAEKLGEQGESFLDRAERACANMHTLVEDLSTYTKVRLERASFGPVELTDAVGSAREHLRGEIEASRATLVVGDLPCVWADFELLTLLLRHLIGNALRYRSTAPPRVELRAEARGERWEISVEDNGIGVPHQHLERIFLPFKRLHPKDRIPGSGIGLNICKRVVEQHGGEIWAESSPGSGTTIRVTLADAASGEDA